MRPLTKVLFLIYYFTNLHNFDFLISSYDSAELDEWKIEWRNSN